MSIAMIVRDKKFWPLFWTQFFGALNDNFLKNAMVILIEYKGLQVMGLDSASIVALAGGIFILPFFLFSMLGGQIADKYERSRLVIYVKMWELCITLVSTFGFYFHSVWFLMSALFMMGCHSTFFGPIKYSSIPDLVRDDQLMAANAYVEAGTFLAILLGTIGGAVLIQLPHGELVISAALNACALIGLWTASRLVKLPSSAHALKIRFNMLSPISDMFKLLHERRDVFYSILAISWFWFFGASALSLLPPYAHDVLHANGNVMTLFLGLWTMGVGIGSLLSEMLAFKKVELGLVPIGTLGVSAFFIDLALATPTPAGDAAVLMNVREFMATGYGPRLMFDFFMMSVAGGLFILPLYTVMQARSEKSFRSRVIAGNNVFNAIFMVASALMIMGLHMMKVSIPTVFILLAAGNLLFCAGVYAVVPEFLRRMRDWFRERFARV